jgi:hypothetical protein
MKTGNRMCRREHFQGDVSVTGEHGMRLRVMSGFATKVALLM